MNNGFQQMLEIKNVEMYALVHMNLHLSQKTITFISVMRAGIMCQHLSQFNVFDYNKWKTTVYNEYQ